MSLWEAYFRETADARTIEYEWGFAVYSYGSDFLSIDEFYIAPAFRKRGKGRSVLEVLKEIARAGQKSYIVTEVGVGIKTAAESLAAQLAVGFVPFQAESGTIRLIYKL